MTATLAAPDLDVVASPAVAATDVQTLRAEALEGRRPGSLAAQTPLSAPRCRSCPWPPPEGHLDLDPERADDPAYVASIYHRVETAIQAGMERLAALRRFLIFF